MTRKPAIAILFFVAVLFGTAAGDDGKLELDGQLTDTGILLTWKVTLPRKVTVEYFVLRILPPGQPVAIGGDKLAGDVREYYYDIWLTEAVTYTFLLEAVLDSGDTMKDRTSVRGPSATRKLSCSGVLGEVGETNAALGGLHIPPAEICDGVRLYNGRELVGNIRPGAKSYLVKDLEPGRRYRLAMVPVKLVAGKLQRGERFLFGPFVTKMKKKWVQVNGGSRLSADEPVGRIQPLAFNDGSGDLYFTIPSEGLGAGMGRYDRKNKKWQVRGVDDWTDNHGVPARPIFDGLFSVRQIRWTNDGAGRVFAVADCATSSGKAVFDIHGNLHNFRFDGGQWEQWTGGKDFGRLDSRPLFNFWGGTGRGWAFADNGKGVGIAALAKSSYGTTGKLAFARLDLSAEECLWQTWFDGAWKPHTSYSFTHLPDAKPAKEEHFESPVAASISATRWIVLFLYSPDGRGGEARWCAMFYDDAKVKWRRWTEGGWADDGPLAPVFEEQLDPLSVVTVNEGRNLSFYAATADGRLVCVKYSSTRKSWGDVEEIAPRVEPGDYYRRPIRTATLGRKTFIAYSSDGYDIQLAGKGRIFSAPNRITLGDIAFANKKPIVFYVEEGELKAVVEKDISGEKPDAAPPLAREIKPKIFDPEVVKYVGSWPNYAEDTANKVRISYAGAGMAGHMDCAADGTLFTPRFVVCNATIFPPDFPARGKSVFWGGFWDHLSFPLGIAVDSRHGKVYIADRATSGGGGGIFGGRVQVWKLSDKGTCRWYKNLGGPNREKDVSPVAVEGPFKWPSGMAVDEKNGFLYVANSLKNEILKFDASGEKPELIASFGSGELSFPRGVAVGAGGEVYVADSRNHRIVKFSSEGKVLSQWGSAGRGEGQFLYPWGIAVSDEYDRVFVTDPQNGRISCFTLAGEHISSWTHFAKPEGKAEFERPSAAAGHSESFGITVSPNGYLYAGAGNLIVKYEIAAGEGE